MCPECNCVIRAGDTVIVFEGAEWHSHCWSGEKAQESSEFKE
jgi:hypothetical protein